MIKYVAGLLFDDDRSKVVLILKDHGPARLIGRWNAVGGKRRTQDPGAGIIDQTYIENCVYEPADRAMRREFLEETGVDLPTWRHFLTLLGPGWEVTFFKDFSTEAVRKVRTKERERVDVWPLTGLAVMLEADKLVANLSWIVSMALGDDGKYEVREL